MILSSTLGHVSIASISEQALINAAEAVAAHGHIFHINPMNVMNHGFYNICPTLMHDFYDQNLWTIHLLKAVPMRPLNFSPTSRFFDVIEYNPLYAGGKTG